MKVVILNDTAPLGHFGCKMVMETLNRELEERGIEVVARIPLKTRDRNANRRWDWHLWRPELDTADLVIVNGEGSLHHDRKCHLLTVAKEYPSALINTSWAHMGPAACSLLKNFKHVFARESYSLIEIAPSYPRAKHAYDLAFGSEINWWRLGPPSYDVCVLDSHVPDSQVKASIDANDPHFVEKFREYARVCTGRYHGVVASILAHRPFSAFRSNTHKTKALMHDVGLGRLYAPTYAEAVKLVPPVSDSDQHSDPAFDAIRDTARESITRMMEEILA